MQQIGFRRICMGSFNSTPDLLINLWIRITDPTCFMMINLLKRFYENSACLLFSFGCGNMPSTVSTWPTSHTSRSFPSILSRWISTQFILPSQSGMWIRIHFLRIRIQLFFSMQIRIQLISWTKCVKNYLIKGRKRLKIVQKLHTTVWSCSIFTVP